MTELQVIALQQITAGLAVFHRDHMLIKSGGITLDTDDTYNVAKTEIAIRVTDTEIRSLCRDAGKTHLVGTGL